MFCWQISVTQTWLLVWWWLLDLAAPEGVVAPPHSVQAWNDWLANAREFSRYRCAGEKVYVRKVEDYPAYKSSNQLINARLIQLPPMWLGNALY